MSNVDGGEGAAARPMSKMWIRRSAVIGVYLQVLIKRHVSMDLQADFKHFILYGRRTVSARRSIGACH